MLYECVCVTISMLAFFHKCIVHRVGLECAYQCLLTCPVSAEVDVNDTHVVVLGYRNTFVWVVCIWCYGNKRCPVAEPARINR